MSRIVRVESSGNPYAIGVVGARLQRQPSSLAEAVRTIEQLERAGFNYSIGLSQINRVHFKRLGWAGDPGRGFEACGNLQAGLDIYLRCRQGAARAMRAASEPALTRSALSCYYSGNYVDGERLGYVDKVLAGSGEAPPARRAPSPRSMFD